MLLVFWLILLYLSSPFDILLLILFYKLDAQNAEIDVSGAVGIIFFSPPNHGRLKS